MAKYIRKEVLPHGGTIAYRIRPAGYALAREVAAKGHGVPTIARLFNIHPDTVRVILKRDPELQAAISHGSAEFEERLAEKIEDIGINDRQWAALLALGKVKAGWREGDAPEHKPQAAPPVQINITIPEAMAPEAAMKIIGGNTDEKP